MQQVLAEPLRGISEKESRCVYSQPTTKEPLLECLPSTLRRETTVSNFNPLEVYSQSLSRPPRSHTISPVSSSEKMEFYVVTHKNTQSQKSLSNMIYHILRRDYPSLYVFGKIMPLCFLFNSKGINFMINIS